MGLTVHDHEPVVGVEFDCHDDVRLLIPQKLKVGDGGRVGIIQDKRPFLVLFRR